MLGNDKSSLNSKLELRLSGKNIDLEHFEHGKFRSKRSQAQFLILNFWSERSRTEKWLSISISILVEQVKFRAIWAKFCSILCLVSTIFQVEIFFFSLENGRFSILLLTLPFSAAIFSTIKLNIAFHKSCSSRECSSLSLFLIYFCSVLSH